MRLRNTVIQNILDLLSNLRKIGNLWKVLLPLSFCCQTHVFIIHLTSAVEHTVLFLVFLIVFFAILSYFQAEFRYGPTVPNNRVSIAQFISNFRDIDCGRNKKGAVPTIMTWIQNDNFYIRLRTGNVCEDKPYNSKEFKLGKVIPGKWHTLVFGGLWEKEKYGFFKVWFDKNLRVDESRIKTWMDTDDRLFQFRVGIYPNWWTWDGSGHPFIKEGHQRTKELYIDSIGFGPTFEDADPWSVDGVNGLKDKLTD